MNDRPPSKGLAVLLLAYGAASLVHFVHNAEFVADYPNMPLWVSRAEVYLAWAGLTIVGISGWLLLSRGYRVAGLFVIAVYAALGMDSLGHYVLAPISSHTMAMNFTILLEVTAAALLFLETLRMAARMTIPRFQ